MDETWLYHYDPETKAYMYMHAWIGDDTSHWCKLVIMSAVTVMPILYSDSRAVIPGCYPRLLSPAVIPGCYPRLLSPDVIPGCYPRLLSTAVIPGCYPRLLSPDVIPGCYPRMLSPAVITGFPVVPFPQNIFHKTYKKWIFRHEQ